MRLGNREFSRPDRDEWLAGIADDSRWKKLSRSEKSPPHCPVCPRPQPTNWSSKSKTRRSPTTGISGFIRHKFRLSTPADVFETSSWDDAAKKLAAGGKVLFTPRLADLAWDSPPLARVPVFWNALMGPTWSRMLGLWCDTNSPALAEFPTEANCDWQWTELLHNVRAINLDKLPRSLTPIVSAIDDWNRNYKLGLIFEAKAGAGKLLVCAIDLNGNASPAAQQLRRSLLDYMAGEKFSPQTEITPADFASLHFDTRIMRELGATATADGRNAGELLDGDPNTFWSSADARGSGTKQPHEIIVRFHSADRDGRPGFDAAAKSARASGRHPRLHG